MPAHNATERHTQTLRLLQDKGRVSVSDLSKRLNVSEVTIRKDLRYLEKRNLLVRTYGGAMPVDLVVSDVPLEQKAEQHAEEKRRIGKEAAGMVDDDDRIILDSGSTTIEVVRHLRHKRNLVAITGSIHVARELLYVTGIELLMLGGMVRPTSGSIIGAYAEQMLRDHSFRKLFLAGDGFDVRYGVTTTNALEAHLNRIMIEAAQQTIVVVDSSKFGRRGLSRICGLESIHCVITDDQVPEQAVRHLEKHGIEVRTV